MSLASRRFNSTPSRRSPNPPPPPPACACCPRPPYCPTGLLFPLTLGLCWTGWCILPPYPSCLPLIERSSARNKNQIKPCNKKHSVIFYHIALSIQTCHMLMAEPSTYDMFVLLKKNGYVDGWAVNIWHVFVSKYLYFKMWKYKLVICWWLSRQHKTSLKVVICWRLSHQHMTTYLDYNIIQEYDYFGIQHYSRICLFWDTA